MSNKHFRRIAKEDELILTAEKIGERIRKSRSSSRSSFSENGEAGVKAKVLNKFSLLDLGGSASEEDCENNSANLIEKNREHAEKYKNDEFITRKSSKKNKKSEISAETTATVMKKAQKKKKKKAAKIAKDTELDNLSLLIELMHKNGEASIQHSKELVMRIDPRLLNPDAEMRRLFGRTFGPTANADRRAGTRSRALHGSRLVQMRPDWPTSASTAFSMCMYKEEDGVKNFRFKHNIEYRELQQLFWNFQAHHDFENIAQTVLAVNPLHLDSLLLMAENLRIHDDIQRSIDVLELGIYACERSFHSTFLPFSADCRLGYEWWENRAFFLLLHRYLLSLVQRSCFATALEFTKLLYLKDERNDPLAILLMIDSLALRAKNYKFLVDFYDTFREDKNLDMLPNFLYSMALANFFLSEQQHTNSSSQAIDNSSAEDCIKNAENYMELALSRFPFILGQILDKLQIQADSAVESNYLLNTLAYYKETEGLRLISNIYLHHSIELWRLPNVISWLEEVTHKILPRLSSSTMSDDNNKTGLRSTVDQWRKKRNKCFVGIPRNVLRHAHIHSIPLDSTNASENANETSEVDPYPPRPSLADYISDRENVEHFNDEANASTAFGANGALAEFMRTLVPEEFQPQLQRVGETVRGYVANILEHFSRSH